MYGFCEIQNKRNWSIQIETAVKALHFEMSNPKNTRENASSFANNTANQVSGDRDRLEGEAGTYPA